MKYLKHYYISIQIALLVIGVTICCIGVLFEIKSHSNNTRTHEKNIQLSAACAHYQLRQLFTQELLWYRLLAKTLKSTRQTLATAKDQERITQRLLHNQEELGALLTTLSCPTPPANQSLTQLLHEQVTQAIRYSQACNNKNSKLKREAQKAWLEVTHKLTHVLTTCQKNSKDPLMLQQALVQHRTLLEQELACENKKSVRTSITQSDAFFDNLTCLLTQLLPLK